MEYRVNLQERDPFTGNRVLVPRAFTSLLEAEWAVFFDTLGLDFLHLPAGTPESTPMVTFWVEDWFSYVRVVEGMSRWEQDEAVTYMQGAASAYSKLLSERSNQHMRPNTLLITGPPLPRDWNYDDLKINHPMVWNHIAGFTEFGFCARCEGLCITNPAEPYRHIDIGPHSCGHHHAEPRSAKLSSARRLLNAYEASHAWAKFSKPDLLRFRVWREFLHFSMFLQDFHTLPEAQAFVERQEADRNNDALQVWRHIVIDTQSADQYTPNKPDDAAGWKPFNSSGETTF